MKILLIFTLGLISDGGASKELTGYSGGGVLIKCKYDTEYTQNQKYFCKGSWPDCSDQIKTGAKNEWINSGRFSLFDDTKSAEFRVMIRELTVQDTGTYYCGVDQPGIDTHKAWELKVKKGVDGPREVTVYAGARSNIKCKYEDEYKTQKKSFCKIETNQWGFKHISTVPDSEWSHDGRFSIHDNRSAGFFSVFIRELNTEDAGTYACAVVESDETEIFTVVKLNVMEDLSYERSVSKTIHEGRDLTVSCKYPKSLRDAPKFFCKRPKLAACFYDSTVKESRKYLKEGRFTLYDDREKQIFTVSMKDMTEQDSEEYWCGAEVNWKSDHGYKLYFTRINLAVTGFPVFVVITVSLSLLVLPIGIAFLVVILQKRCRERIAQALSGTNADHENNPTVIPLQSRQSTSLPQPAYQNLERTWTTDQSDSLYQSLTH